MLSVVVDYLMGTVHAGPHDDTGLTGQPNDVEWPPSPARLYSAMVAADGSGERTKIAHDTTALSLLEDPPVIYAESADTLARTELVERFAIVEGAEAGSNVQNYPLRKAQAVREGVRASIRRPLVAFCWDAVDPTDSQLEQLRLRARRIGYLGRSTSPVRVAVHRELPDRFASLPKWLPDPEGNTAIPVAYDGLLDDLDWLFDLWSQDSFVRRDQVPPLLAWYRDPNQVDRPEPPLECVWVDFSRKVPGRLVLAVAKALRDATLTRYEEAVGSRDLVPEVLTGHPSDGSQRYFNARWLPLLWVSSQGGAIRREESAPRQGSDHADGMIRGACIALPRSTDPSIITLVRAIVSGLKLRLGAAGVINCSLRGKRGLPVSTAPGTWSRPSRRYVSVTPVLFERMIKGPLTLEAVAQWCEYAQLPRPVAMFQSKTPLVNGGVNLRNADLGDKPYLHRQRCHLELWFQDPVEGPVSVGRGRNLGIGLMLPVPDARIDEAIKALTAEVRDD